MQNGHRSCSRTLLVSPRTTTSRCGTHTNGANITPDQVILLWYGFYHNLSRERTSCTTIAYPPIIYAKPVDVATMYTTMRKFRMNFQSHIFLFLGHLLQILQILLLSVWKEREITGIFIYRRNKSWFHISLLPTDKTRCLVEAPLKLDNLLGVRFRDVSMGHRATWAQRKQNSHQRCNWKQWYSRTD